MCIRDSSSAVPAEALDDTAREAAPSNALLDALREVAQEGNAESAVSCLLERARDAMGAERAFLVEEAEEAEEGEEDAPPHVLGRASLRPEESGPSGTASRH